MTQDKSRQLSRRLPRPVFVVGCCNSGTTNLWQAIRQHPDFAGPPFEGQNLKDLPRCMRHFLGRETSRMFAHPRFKMAYRVTERDYDAWAARRMIAVYAEHCPSDKRFIEKSPANSVRTRFLQEVFPDATFVIIVRNGVAVAEGIRRKRLFDPERPHLAGLRTTIREGAEQWYHANRTLLHDRRYLRRSILVHYEQLVTDPRAVLNRVLSFCGCDPTLIQAPSLDRDQNERQIRRLSGEEIVTIHEVAGDLLKKFGYAAARRSGR